MKLRFLTALALLGIGLHAQRATAADNINTPVRGLPLTHRFRLEQCFIERRASE